jgi:hypothetical protein
MVCPADSRTETTVSSARLQAGVGAITPILIRATPGRFLATYHRPKERQP